MNNVIKGFVIAIVGLCLSYLLSHASSPQKYTELRVFNVYKSVSLKLEVKCDWVSEEKKYKFYQIVKVPRNSNIVIKAPWGLHECQIWPLGIEFF